MLPQHQHIKVIKRSVKQKGCDDYPFLKHRRDIGSLRFYAISKCFKNDKASGRDAGVYYLVVRTAFLSNDRLRLQVPVG